MSLLIFNVTIFTNNDKVGIISNGALAIEKSQIIAIGPQQDLKKKYSHFSQIDGRGRLLMPGFVNAHMHFYSTFARGIAMQGSPKNFSEILQMLWWKLDSVLDLEAVYYSALVPAISAVKNGITSVIDHHASPNAVDGSLDKIEDALVKVGLRASLCYEVSDRDGQAISDAGLAENERYIKKCQALKNQDEAHLFDGMIGLHASFTLENNTLEKAGALIQNLEKGCHIHVLEDKADQKVTQKKYGMGVINRLRYFQILRPETIAVHCIHLSEKDKDSLAESGAIVVHNPQSNMNNTVGRTDIFGLLERGIRLGLGTDGMSPNLMNDIRAANLIHKHDLRQSTVGWTEIEKMVLQNNPAIFEKVTGQQVGKLEEGALADVILVDYFAPTPLTADNFWGHYLFGIADALVDTTIINGKIVMQNKEIVGIDELAIARKSIEVAKQVWDKF
ncbi:MAG: putative aminohydrolase SsnA [Calditrichaeota bacterium]|nr:MAG: putative aminohydrolase SsnA [Calditrichota bacterium]